MGYPTTTLQLVTLEDKSLLFLAIFMGGGRFRADETGRSRYKHLPFSKIVLTKDFGILSILTKQKKGVQGEKERLFCGMSAFCIGYIRYIGPACHSGPARRKEAKRTW